MFLFTQITTFYHFAFKIIQSGFSQKKTHVHKLIELFYHKRYNQLLDKISDFVSSTSIDF